MFDLVVLGGGAGGLNVASAAARVGAKVALVERDRLGGECTFSACVPSKALIQAARAAHWAREAGAYGIRVAPPEIDFPAVMARVRAVVAACAVGDSAETLRARGVTVFQGSARFEAYDTVLVDETTRVEGERFVIATGARPAIPEVPGLEEAGYLTNVTLWDLNSLPEALVIIGGGPTGVELAQAFVRLGSRVTLLTDADALLPREEAEVATRVAKRLAAEGVTIQTGVVLNRVFVREGQKVVAFRERAARDPLEAAGTHILVATGRWAHVEGLNLEAVRIRADRVRGIEVDDHLRTDNPRIYAVGDVLQRDQSTHAAEREAAVVFQNAILHLPKPLNTEALPRVTFVDPEVAAVGMSEDDALAQHPEARVLRAEFAELDRARIDGPTDGFAKVIALPSGKILGAVIVGADAALVLQELVVAIEHGLTLHDLAGTVHPYPTSVGIVRKLALEFAATRLESGWVRTALKWFWGFQPAGG